MRSRQFSSKDIGEKQENKRMGTKTLTSSPNNFQLKAIESSESSTVDSSNGVAQLMFNAAARVGGRGLARAATAVGPGAMAAARTGGGNGLNMLGKFTGVVAGVTTGLQAADIGSQFALGVASGDKYATNGAIFNGLGAAGQAIFPGETGEFLGELSSAAGAQNQERLENDGEQPLFDEEIGRPISPETLEMMAKADSYLERIPGAAALSPSSALKSASNIIGRGRGVLNKIELDQDANVYAQQNTDAKLKASAAAADTKRYAENPGQKALDAKIAEEEELERVAKKHPGLGGHPLLKGLGGHPLLK